MTVHRIVLLDFPEEPSADDVGQLGGLLDAAATAIPGIQDYVLGRNIADPTSRYGLIVRFASAADHQLYLPHPAHRAVGEFLRSRNFRYELAVVDDSAAAQS